MNVSMTVVATTIRTRFDCGGMNWDPEDIANATNDHQEHLFRCSAGRVGLEIFLSGTVTGLPVLVFFQHAFGRPDSSDDDHRNSPYQTYDEEVLEDREEIPNHKVHGSHCSPVIRRNQKLNSSLLEFSECPKFQLEPGCWPSSPAGCKSLFFRNPHFIFSAGLPLSRCF